MDGRVAGVHVSEPGAAAASGFVVSAATVQDTLPFLREGSAAPLPRPAGPTATPVPIPDPLSQSVTEFGLGDLIRLGDLVAVVLGWREPELPVHIRPNPDTKYVAVDLALVNAGDRDISRLFTIQLKDSATHVYDPDRRWGEFAKGAELPGEGVISPGERIRSEVAFQIAADSEGLLLSFTLRTLGGQEALIALGPRPRAIEPPALIPGETRPTIFAAGEPVQTGDVELLLHGAQSLTEGLPVRPDSGFRFVGPRPSGEEPVNGVDSDRVQQADDAKGLAGLHLRHQPGDVVGHPLAGHGFFDAEQVKQGLIVFEIPHDADGLTFIFEPLFGFGKVVIAVDPD